MQELRIHDRWSESISARHSEGLPEWISSVEAGIHKISRTQSMIRACLLCVPSLLRKTCELQKLKTHRFEAAGYRLLQDPQMHFSKKRDSRTEKGSMISKCLHCDSSILF